MIICKVINKKTGMETNRWEKSKFPMDYYEPCFGLKERWVHENDCTQEQIDSALDERISELSFGGMDYLLPAEFEIVQEDLAPQLLEHRWSEIRKERNNLLAACDWTQLADAPLNSEEKQVWRNYRQELRDLPQQSGDPENITWPIKPE